MNLILGAATGYNKKDLYYFIMSLRKIYSDDIYLIFNLDLNIETNKFLDENNIKKIFTNEKPKKIFKTRFKIYFNFLKDNTKYHNILITDTRDVIFQKNPFLEKKLSRINFFMEDKVIKNCFFNSNWIKRLYGKEKYEKIKNFQISCSGTTIGSHKALLEYLFIMNDHINKYSYYSLFKSPGTDQGNHNYIINTIKFADSKKFSNNDGIVATLSDADMTNFKLTKKFLNKNNEEFSIIHQYDRFFNEKKKTFNKELYKYFENLRNNLI